MRPKAIDFRKIAAALGRVYMLVSQWLPGGEVAGAEYKCLNPTRVQTLWYPFHLRPPFPIILQNVGLHFFSLPQLSIVGNITIKFCYLISYQSFTKEPGWY